VDAGDLASVGTTAGALPKEAPHLAIMVTSATFVTMTRKAKVVPAGVFKAKCLALFDEVEARGHSFVITKRGRPVARVVPLANDGRGLRGSLVHEHDLLAPVAVEWESAT
jgi:prevent-host-death family protein